jgi:DHA1 family multidrug resistance protein-like MFS transporter
MPFQTWILLLVVACAMAGNGLIVPILPHYGESFSSSSLLVGMLITIFGVARLSANYPTGLAYNRFGAASLMVFGNLLLTVGAVGAALTTSLEMLLFCRALQGLGSGVFLTAMAVVIARQSRAGSRGRLMARYQTAVFVGAGLGPVAGGFIAEHFGITGPFWFYAAVSAFAMLVSATVTTHEPEPLMGGPTGARAQLGVIARSPILRANLAVAFANGFVRTAALWQLIPLLAAAHFGMGFDKVGLAVTITSLANVAILPASGRLVDRFGWRHLPPLASIGYAGSLLTIGFGQAEWAFWAGVVLAGMFGGLIGPASSTALIELTEPSLLPSASGLQRTANDLGFVLGPVTVGMLSDTFGISHGLGLALTAALLLSSAAIWSFALLRVRSG